MPKTDGAEEEEGGVCGGWGASSRETAMKDWSRRPMPFQGEISVLREGGTSTSPSHLLTSAFDSRFFFFLPFSVLWEGKGSRGREWSWAEAAGSLRLGEWTVVCFLSLVDNTNTLMLSHSSFSNILLPAEYFGEWLSPPTPAPLLFPAPLYFTFSAAVAPAETF